MIFTFHFTFLCHVCPNYPHTGLTTATAPSGHQMAIVLSRTVHYLISIYDDVITCALNQVVIWRISVSRRHEGGPWQSTLRRITEVSWYYKYYHRQISIISRTKPKTEMFVVSSCSCLCPIHWGQGLSRKWRCSWSADRRCTNNIWVIKVFA